MSSYSQINDSIINGKTSKFYTYKFNFDTIQKNALAINLKLDTKNSNSFLAYNKNTGLNDLYFIKNDTTYYYVKSINLNDSNQYPKKDSFNPYGASDFKSGLIIGAVGELFKGIFNND